MTRARGPKIGLLGFWLCVGLAPSPLHAREAEFAAEVDLPGVALDALYGSGRSHRDQSGLTTPVTVVLPVRGHRALRVRFEPRSIRSRGYRMRASHGGVKDTRDVFHFRGTPAGGDPGDRARLSVFRDAEGRNQVLGWLIYQGEMFMIEPSAVAGPASDNLVLSVHTVELDAKDAAFCGVRPGDSGTVAPQSSGSAHSSESLATEAAMAGPREVELGLDADFEFFGLYGANSAAAVEISVNFADGLLYQPQLDLTLVIDELNIWTGANDPYGHDPIEDSTESIDDFVLNNKLMVNDVRGLFSGREIPGTAIGVADHTGGVCANNHKPRFNNGFIVEEQDATTDIEDALVVAHEIGHVLGAEHTLEEDADPNTCSPTHGVMCWQLDVTRDQFNDDSIGQINYVVEDAACIGVSVAIPALGGLGRGLAFTLLLVSGLAVFAFRR